MEKVYKMFVFKFIQMEKLEQSVKKETEIIEIRSNYVEDFRSL